MANTTEPRWADLGDSSEEDHSYVTDQNYSYATDEEDSSFIDDRDAYDNDSLVFPLRTKGEGEGLSGDSASVVGDADEDENDSIVSSDSNNEKDFAAWVGNLQYLNQPPHAHLFQLVVIDWSRSRRSTGGGDAASSGDEASPPADTALHTLARRVYLEGDSVLYQTEVLDEVLLLMPEALQQRDSIGETPLHVALSNENDETAELLLSRLWSKRSRRRQRMGKKVGATQNKYGCTPLHHAVRYGASPSVLSKVITLFPEAAAFQNQLGQTPLHEAVRKGNRQAAKEVLEHLTKKMRREVICQKDKKHSNTALHISTHDAHIFLDLIARCRDAAAIRDCDGSTPLHRFASCRGYGRGRQLIKALRILTPTPEAVLARRPDDGQTAFHIVCERMYFNSRNDVEKTLKSFHDVAPGIGLVKDTSGNTALHVALTKFERYPLYIGVDELIETYLVIWPKVASMANAEGNTPLHLACMQVGLPTKNIITSLQHACPESMGMLNKSGLTPLHLLCSVEIADFGYTRFPQPRHVHTSNLLVVYLEAAVIVNIEKKKHSCVLGTLENIGEIQEAMLGNTPLHFAVSNPSGYFSPSSINVYINAWPKALSVANKDGNTPLHLACAHCARRYPDLISLLLRTFPDAASQVNRRGQTPLHVLCSVQSMRKRRTMPLPSTVALLMKANPKVTAFLDKSGNTPLHCAFLNGADCAVKELLLRSGKEALSLENSNGQTVLHCACMARPNAKFLSFLLEANSHAMGIADKYGNTPLHYALLCKGSAYKKILLSEAGEDVLCTANANGQRPLHLACMRRNSLEIFDHLLQVSPESAMAVDKEGNTPAHLAFLYRLPLDVKRRILEVGSGAVGIANVRGDTPLSMPSTVNELFQLIQAVPFVVRPC